MKLKNGKKPYLNSFWNLNIKDVETLKDLGPTSLFVAFDLEYSNSKSDSASQNIIEVGLAFFQLDANHCLQSIPQNSNLEAFFEQNQIKAYSIRSVEILEKKASRESLKFGTKLLINSCNFNSTIIELLSTSITLHSRKHVILVGWSMIAALEWISHNCPQFVSYLTAWADLQDMVISKDPPSLLRTLRAIGVADHDPDSKNRSHRASNDAVRCLAVLFRLFTESIFIPQTVAQYSRIPALPKGPPPGIPRTAQPKYPFGVYISAANGSPLPAICHTPKSLHHKFSSYDLRAVGLDCKEIRENGFFKCWWMAFQTLESLNKFVTDHNGGSIQGISLSIQVVDYS